MYHNEEATQITVEQANKLREKCKDQIADAEALDQLHRSPAFKRLILKGFFENKAAELARATTQMSLDERSKTIHQHGLIGISSLQAHFAGIYRTAEDAQSKLVQLDSALEEDAAEMTGE